MDCPECAINGLISTSEISNTAIELSENPYYDGKVYHDHKCHVTTYVCSRGHMFTFNSPLYCSGCMANALYKKTWKQRIVKFFCCT